MMLAIHAFFVFAVPAICIFSLHMGGWWLWLVPAWGFGAVILLDLLMPGRTRKPYAPLPAWLCRALTWAVVPVQAATVIYGLVQAGHFSAGEVALAALAVGLFTGGIGITTAHELIHRPDRWSIGLGVTLLAMVSYSHFRIEHVYGHHRNIGLKHDPATARRGETIYGYLLRMVPASFASAWALEAERRTRRGQKVIGWGNRMLHYIAIEIILMVAVTVLVGPAGLCFFLLQSLVAIATLEVTEYVEHYGLERSMAADGRPETVQARHSWNTPHRATNWSLFNLGLHADHHMRAGKEYQTLECVEGAPQHPAGYTAMILLALLPPVWFALMHPKLDRIHAAA